MRIIHFSSTTTAPSFWTRPVQALAPWVRRFKHSIQHSIQQAVPAAPGDVDARARGLSCLAGAANDAVFALPEAPVRPGYSAFSAAPGGLRVVRELDSTLHAECAGRMVISGRMADVCAELDRMVLRAAAAQPASFTARS